MDIRVHDKKTFEQITYRRLVSYLSAHGWERHRVFDDGKEAWGITGSPYILVYPSVSYPGYHDNMMESLNIIARSANRGQLFVVAELLGDVMIATSKGQTMVGWREWKIDDGIAEMKVVAYEKQILVKYKDGDKRITCQDIMMDDTGAMDEVIGSSMEGGMPA